jgi:transcriptional antiterminator
MFISKEDFDEWMRRIMERFDRLESRMNKQEQPVPTINGEKLMDNQDLCIFLNVCKRTLQYYRTKGWLPYKKIDQKTYYSESDIQAFLREHMKNMRKKPGNGKS